MSQNIEDRQVNGITNKLIITVIASVITLSCGGAAFYYGLMNKIDKVSQMQEQRKIEVDLQLSSINEKVDGVKDDVKDVKADIKDLRNK